MRIEHIHVDSHSFCRALETIYASIYENQRVRSRVGLSSEEQLAFAQRKDELQHPGRLPGTRRACNQADFAYREKPLLLVGCGSYEVVKCRIIWRHKSLTPAVGPAPMARQTIWDRIHLFVIGHGPRCGRFREFHELCSLFATC